MSTTAKDRLSSLVDNIVAVLASDGVALTQSQVNDAKRVAGDWIDNSQYKVLQLDGNKPDYNQIVLQLQNALEHEEAWRDTITASGGQAILRFVSSAISLAILAQERTTQERFSYLARLPSSVFASTRSLGVRIVRTKPATVTVSLSRTGTDYLLIPEFTGFTIGSFKFFNRSPIVFAKGNVFEVEAELTQGEIFTDSYKSPGLPFVSYEVGTGDAIISEEDIYVYVDNTQYTRTTDGFFLYGPNDTVFYENTLHNGNVEVILGSGNYGVMPPSNADIQIKYATTSGVEAHNSSSELPVFCPSISTISGTTVTTINGATVPRSTDFYRVNAPYIRAAQDRAVLRRDYEIKALAYPDLAIKDARVIGQREIAPESKAYMGVIKASALTDNTMTDTEWDKFAAYLQSKGIADFQILREDPSPVSINIDISLGINPSFSLEAAKLAAISALTTAYAPQQGVLGQDFFRNDLSTIITTSTDPALKGAVNWINIVDPTDTSITLGWNQYVKLGTINVTTEYSTRNYSNRLQQ